MATQRALERSVVVSPARATRTLLFVRPSATARFCRAAGALRVLEHAVVCALTGESRVQLFERDACRSTGSTARVLDPPRSGRKQRAARRAVRCNRSAPAARQNRQRIPPPFTRTPFAPIHPKPPTRLNGQQPDLPRSNGWHRHCSAYKSANPAPRCRAIHYSGHG